MERQTLFAITVEDDVTNATFYFSFESIAEATRAIVPLIHFLLRKFRSNTKRDDVRD